MDTGDRGGFTIIEVVLVLAIAGLIFLMVFIALPALQRSQRDTQRRDDMARLGSMITQYQSNNNGRIPTASGSETIKCEPSGSTYGEIGDGTNNIACSFIRNYMNSANAADADESEFVDPTGDPYKLYISQLPDGGKTLGKTDYASKIVYFFTSARCDGESAVASSSKRDYAILYKLEGAGTYCADNGS